MTLSELLETLKILGVTLTLAEGDRVRIEPIDVLTPTVRAAITEHQSALAALIHIGPTAVPSVDALLTALNGLGPRPPSAVLQECLGTLAAGLTGADPLFRAPPPPPRSLGRRPPESAPRG
jgi:TubC N-terminal docking domain